MMPIPASARQPMSTDTDAKARLTKRQSLSNLLPHSMITIQRNLPSPIIPTGD
jgi:hypothetical protein